MLGRGADVSAYGLCAKYFICGCRLPSRGHKNVAGNHNEAARARSMNISFAYWFGIAILDAFLRIFYTIIASMNPLLIPIMLEYTAIHLLCLIPTNLAAILLGFRGRISGIIVLLITNSLFCVVFAVSWVTSIRRGRQSSCVGYQYKCDWIDGVITDLGVQALTREGAIQVGTNLAAVLFVWLLASETQKATQA